MRASVLPSSMLCLFLSIVPVACRENGSEAGPSGAQTPVSVVAAATPTPTGTPIAVYRVGGDVVAPEVIDRATLDWSKLGRLRGAGTPIVEALISEHGEVEDVRVIRSAGTAIDSVVIEAIRQWKFRPATRHGKPVPVYFTVTININWQ